jgi:ADP-heptose:LPS heptosyltransferase
MSLLLKLNLFFRNILLDFLSLNYFVKSNEAKKIVVFRNSSLGDFLQIIPALNMLRSLNPGAKIVLVTGISTKSYSNENQVNSISWTKFVEDNLVDSVYKMNDYGQKSIIKLRSFIKEFDPEMIINLPFQTSTFFSSLKHLVFFRFLSMSASVYGIKLRAIQGIMKKYQIDNKVYRHAIYGPLEAVQEISAPVQSFDEYIHFNDVNFCEHSVSPMLKDAIKKIDSPQKNICTISISSLKKHKDWGYENFSKLIEFISSNQDFKNLILFPIGLEEDSDKINMLFPNAEKEILKTIGKLNIFDLCYLFRRSKLLIANDGGACHLAAISSCPVVAITSGCNYPDAIYPINSKKLVIRNDDHHSACFNFQYCKICDDAIKDIAVDDVLKKVRLILNERI